MSLRIRWQSDQGEGVFPLRTRFLHLVCEDGVFDVAAAVGEGLDGLSLSPPDGEGRIEAQAHGALEFVSGEKRFARVRLPVGGAVSFEVGEHSGRIRAEGKAPVQDPLVGTELGGHRILGRLGAGAVGVVYRALQINLDREVALKMLDQQVATRAEAVASFKREARAAGRLTHPHVVQVYDVGEDQGRHYYTMELVPGGDLEDRLAEGGPLPWPEAAAAARDCCRALAFAEEHGLVHRDVKPENLMVAPGGIVKLADLGLAATRGMLDTEAAGGTPHFMAPEAVGKGSVDHRSDLYSVGCTLYRLLSGHTVFAGSSVKEILRAHRDQEPESLRDGGVELPRELDDLVLALLAKDPDERYQHASEVVADLDAALAAQGGRRGLLVVMPLLLVLGAVGWLLFGPKAPEPAEPERVVEYVDRGGADEAELERERVRAAYFEALAQPVADGQRRAALETFLEGYPDAEQVADAQAELDRLAAAAAAAAEENSQPVETPEERAAREAKEQALAAVESALQRQAYGQARELARTGPLATDSAMIALAETVDAQAGAQFKAWETAHASALAEQDWAAAQTIRGSFAEALGEQAPPDWTARLTALESGAREAEAAAAQARFRAQREAFLAAAVEPVRQPLAQLAIGAAAAAWRSAAQGIEHEGLRELAAGPTELLTRAARARQLMQQRVAAEEPEVEEYTEGRKADVLGLGADGLRLQVQIRGERVERTDPWSAYFAPQSFAALLRALAPESGEEAAFAALYYLIACDRLATDLNELAGQPDAAGAARMRATLEAWQTHQPHPEALPAGCLGSLETALALCAALEEGDDYLALERLLALQESFGLLSVWTSGGDSSWGLEP